jgi:pimeloyl-ACP methyl ester carboxylesterase
MQGAPALWHFGFHAQRDIAEALIAGRERLYIESFIRARAFNPAAISDAEIDIYTAMMAAPGSLRGGLEYYRTFDRDAAANKEFAAEKLSIPVLGIGGGRLGPILKGIVASLSDDAHAETIADCGHWVVAERPNEFVGAVNAFLG